ncbi:MAG: aminoacyl-tRNA hydrolase [Spirochaetes bacterium]|nr:aminoacyl-tRNA hydrolase [Spirochaetota bacterium]
MKLVLGLGNPGDFYAMHRHNIGFIMIERLAKNLGMKMDIRKKKTIFARGKMNNIEFLLLKPLTFMNLSGEAALYMASFMKITVKDVIVIYDDMDIPLGKFKVRVGGSDGGHNGVKSIAESLKSPEFTRIRIGIGRPKKGGDIADYVLSPFTKTERENLRTISDGIIDAVKLCMFQSPVIAMNKYNKRD